MVQETRVDLSNDMYWRHMIGVGVRRMVLGTWRRKEGDCSVQGERARQTGRDIFVFVLQTGGCHEIRIRHTLQGERSYAER